MFFLVYLFLRVFFSKTYRSRCRRAGSRGESRAGDTVDPVLAFYGAAVAPLLAIEYDAVDIFPGPRNPDVAAIVRSRRTLYLHVIRVC